MVSWKFVPKSRDWQSYLLYVTSKKYEFLFLSVKWFLLPKQYNKKKIQLPKFLNFILPFIWKFMNAILFYDPQYWQRTFGCCKINKIFIANFDFSKIHVRWNQTSEWNCSCFRKLLEFENTLEQLIHLNGRSPWKKLFHR